MPTNIKFWMSLLVFSIHLICFSQYVKRDTIYYKQKDSISLMMEVHYPPMMEKTKKYPGMLFYSGGPWNHGKLNQFRSHASYFAKRGVICFLVEYGRKNSEEFMFSECISDTKSSIRYIRENAKRFNLDIEKIVAAGASSGGHLASSLALIEGYEDPNDNTFFKSIPNALVLFNPVVDLGPASPLFFKEVGDQYKNMSPIHNIKSGAPPTIILIGTEDVFIPVEMVKYYKLVMDKVGSRCDLILYDGMKHGFFNVRNMKNFRETVLEVDKFLISLGYIKGKPSIMTE